MSGPPRSKRSVPALFTALGNVVGEHWKGIGGVTGGVGGLVTILDGLFGIQLVLYGNALAQFLISDSFVTILLFVMLISQILLYQRVEWIVNQLENRGEDEDGKSDRTPTESEIDAEAEEALTDGGSSKTQPRDSKGRFTTRNSGGSNLFLLVLAAATGYLIGVETGTIDPIGAALIAVALIAFLQSTDG